MFTSTRKNLNLKASNCIIKGISDEGGLFIYQKLNNLNFDESFLKLNYQELAFKILKNFLDDFTDEQIYQVIKDSYNQNNFLENLTKIQSFDKFTFLELFHGPTMAFKDMALTILPNLLKTAKSINRQSSKTLILTATSGDTGGAALSGFSQTDDAKIIVLYPTCGVSKFQESQMHYYANKNAIVIAIDGNFDDCQNLVKKIFTSNIKLKNLELSSANSINIGRLIPQIIYYFDAYIQMVNNKTIKFKEKINVSVPTGNFGNILACYIAKKMGLYIDKIICASNENNVLTDFFTTFEYNKNRKFYVTNSPAMDILISSNLERLLYLITNRNIFEVNKMMDDLKNHGSFKLDKAYQANLKDFLATSITQEETSLLIKKCYEENHYLIDPHTAVAYGAYLNKEQQLKGKTLIVSTASPYKFIETIDQIFQTNKDGLDRVNEIAKLTNMPVPKILEKIYQKPYDKVIWNKENMEENLRKLIGDLDENC